MRCSKLLPQPPHTPVYQSWCLEIINVFILLWKNFTGLRFQLSSHIYFPAQMHRKQTSHHHCLHVKEEKLLKLFSKFLQNQLLFIMQTQQGFGGPFYLFYCQLVIQSALGWTLQANEGHHLLVCSWLKTPSTYRASPQQQIMQSKSCLDPQ